MKYGKFVEELSKGIEGKICAYDSTPDLGGCFIYLQSLEQSIFIPAEIIDKWPHEAIPVLRAKIREGIGDTPHLVLTADGHTLSFATQDVAPV